MPKIANPRNPTGDHRNIDSDRRTRYLTAIRRQRDRSRQDPREIAKTRTITGGLPRVAESCSARRPARDPAVVSEIDGTVEFGKIVRGQQRLLVHGEHGEVHEYLIPHGKHMHVHSNDRVKAGDRLCEGAVRVT